MSELNQYTVTESHRLLTASRPHKGMAPFGMCVTCHTRTPKPGEAQPPYIPFDDTWALGHELATTDLMSRIEDRITRDDIKKMPKDLPHLSKSQVESFVSLLRKLKKASKAK